MLQQEMEEVAMVATRTLKTREPPVKSPPLMLVVIHQHTDTRTRCPLDDVKVKAVQEGQHSTHIY